MTPRRACSLAWLLLLLLAAAPAAATTDPCEAPEEFTDSAGPLPGVAAALRANRLVILALGSGSLRTGSPNRNGASVPRYMAEALQAARPGLAVDLTVRGGKDLTAADMLGILRSELSRTHPRLVIWQTGTVDAVRNIPPGEFYQSLMEGVSLVQASGADLVFVDPQFSRFLRANADLDPYEETLQQMASLPAVTLFRRFDLMHHWVDEGRLDIERVAPEERAEAVTTLHACLGRLLARLILNGGTTP